MPTIPRDDEVTSITKYKVKNMAYWNIETKNFGVLKTYGTSKTS